MIIIDQDEDILESYTFSEWPLKLRTGQITLTNKSFYAIEGTWGIKTSIQCRYDQIIHTEYKDSIDYTLISLGLLSLLFYMFIVTIPIGFALIHRGLQKQLKIGIEIFGLKTIYGPQNVLLRVLKQINSQITNPSFNVIYRKGERVHYEKPQTNTDYARSSRSDNKNRGNIITENGLFNHSAPVNRTRILPPFYCELCAIKHPAGIKRMQCEACGRSICLESFFDMTKADRTVCPLCDGKLSASE